MPAVAEAKIEGQIAAPRRFQLPDMDRQREWLMPRLQKAYVHLNDRQLIGWLRAIVYSQEFMFLFSDDCCGLFQVMSAHTLSPQPVIYERFVFIADKDSVTLQQRAGDFYHEVRRWAEHHGAGAIIVEQMTDVPHEVIRDRLGRLLQRQEWFYKL
jgi:hypothetical protein